MGKTERVLWIGCMVMGLATLFVALIIFSMFPTDTARDVSGYGGPIYAFEFARSPADLLAVFGGVEDPERERRLAMMNQGNRWDFLFMSAYTLFAILFGLAARNKAPRLGSRLIAVALIAGFADMMETRTLLSIAADLKGGLPAPAGLHDLWKYVFVKFAALALSVFVVGLFLISLRSKIWKFLGAITACSALLTIIALWQPDQFGGLLSLSIGTGWIVMLTYAAMQVKLGLKRR